MNPFKKFFSRCSRILIFRMRGPRTRMDSRGTENPILDSGRRRPPAGPAADPPRIIQIVLPPRFSRFVRDHARNAGYPSPEAFVLSLLRDELIQDVCSDDYTLGDENE